jgi:UDP-glucuronate 4-epimerase
VDILVTGAAGFIGYHVASALLARGERVVGIDNLNNYYDIRLKQARLQRLMPHRGFSFQQIDVSDKAAMLQLVEEMPDISRIVHLAAQAGVRYSLIDPYSYVQSNVMGHLVVQEAARRLPRLEHMVYASSSSVYGANRVLPFTETEQVDSPVSLYAATKRADELMSYTYGHLFGLPQTGLRFFSVYGPWGRPDMAYYMFARAIDAGEPITVFDHGTPRRDFTFIDDIVAGVVGCLDRPPVGSEEPGGLPVRVLNIGNNRSEPVSHLIALLEEALGRKAIVHNMQRSISDMEETYASVDAIGALTGYAPTTPLSVGIPRFVAWYRDFHAAELPVGVAAQA